MSKFKKGNLVQIKPEEYSRDWSSRGIFKDVAYTVLAVCDNNLVIIDTSAYGKRYLGEEIMHEDFLMLATAEAIENSAYKPELSIGDSVVFTTEMFHQEWTKQHNIHPGIVYTVVDLEPARRCVHIVGPKSCKAYQLQRTIEPYNSILAVESYLRIATASDKDKHDIMTAEASESTKPKHEDYPKLNRDGMRFKVGDLVCLKPEHFDEDCESVNLHPGRPYVILSVRSSINEYYIGNVEGAPEIDQLDLDTDFEGKKFTYAQEYELQPWVQEEHDNPAIDNSTNSTNSKEMIAINVGDVVRIIEKKYNPMWEKNFGLKPNVSYKVVALADRSNRITILKPVNEQNEEEQLKPTYQKDGLEVHSTYLMLDEKYMEEQLKKMFG